MRVRDRTHTHTCVGRRRIHLLLNITPVHFLLVKGEVVRGQQKSSPDPTARIIYSRLASQSVSQSARAHATGSCNLARDKRARAHTDRTD